MTIKEFIQEFKALGYNDDTDLVIGAYDTNGDWYSFDFEIVKLVEFETLL